MNRQKPLDLASRLEALHLPFSSSRRLMGILGSIVKPLVLTMFDAGHGFALGGGVALQLVGHQHPWRYRQLVGGGVAENVSSEY